MRLSVLAELFDGFADLDDFFSGFAVSNIPQCVPIVLCFLQTKKSTILSQF